MKRLFITLLSALLLLAGPALAQRPATQPPSPRDLPADPVRQKLDDLFAHLDKSQIPSGRLLEAALPLAPVPLFDGSLHDSARADMDVFRHLYATALSARLAGTETLPAIQDYNQRVRAAAPTAPGDPIPVAVQYLRYNTLRPDAERARLLRLQNQQLYDVPTRRDSPYLPAVLFAAAPERSYSASSTVALVLRRSLYLADDTRFFDGDSTIYLDFDDGRGYQPAAWDQPLRTSYATGGAKRIKVRLIYSGADDLPEARDSWFDLTVAAPPAAARYANDVTYDPTRGFDRPFSSTVVGDLSSTDYTHHLGAMVNVRYGRGHTHITKPFIVVEGYNTATIAPHLTGKNNQNNTIKDFLQDSDIDFINTGNFNDNLEQAGYDLIYIDFNYGTDDIRRNAKLFEEVVAWVNEQKRNAGSNEQNVVMGESMGGLVARYGLARLVRNGYNPQTRLLILHDSPQRGANNPMGLQALTRQVDFPVALLPGNNQGGATGVVRTSDLSDKLKEALAILAAPATSQLSIKSVTGIDYEYQDNTFIDGPYKEMVDFGGTPPAGFPAIIATSDGSQCGIAQSTPPYQELTRNTRNYLLGGPGLFYGGLRTEAIVNALPAYGTQKTIAHLRVWFTIRVLWLRVDVNLLNRNYTSPANTLPYETLPGGTTNLNEQEDLTTNHANGFLGLWDFSDHTTLYTGNICFVPTYSALDVPTVAPATAYAKYVNGLTDNPNPPRVARYIGQERTNGSQFNQAHIRFTARNSEWLFNQMENRLEDAAAVACSSECDVQINRTFSGPDNLCGTATYSAPVTNPGFTYSWQASPANLFSPASGTGPTFQTSSQNVAGYTASITLTIRGGCSPIVLTRYVTSGSPASPASRGPNWGNDCGGAPVRCTIDNYDPSLTYTVAVSGDLRLIGGIQEDGTYTVRSSRAGGTGIITLTARNSCGTSTSTMRATSPTCNGHRFTISPNPAVDELVVQETEGDSTEPAARSTNDGIESLRLYDSYGQLRLEQAGHQAKAVRLSVGQLPAGIYVLHIVQAGATVSQQRVEIAR